LRAGSRRQGGARLAVAGRIFLSARMNDLGVRNIRPFRSKPSLPLTARTTLRAVKFTECRPLVSAVPRPCQHPSRSVIRNGGRPAGHFSGTPVTTSP